MRTIRANKELIKPNRKKRRHSGRYSPSLTVNPKDMISEDIPYVYAYDDWNNYRDSYRDNSDRSMKRDKYSGWDARQEEVIMDNKKLKKLNKRRKARKNSPRNRNS